MLPLLVCAKTFSQHAGAVKVRAQRDIAYRCTRSARACRRRRQCGHRSHSSPHSVDILRLRNIGSSLSNQASRSRLGVHAAIIPQRKHCRLLIGHLQDRAVRRYFMINAVASAELQDQGNTEGCSPTVATTRRCLRVGSGSCRSGGRVVSKAVAYIGLPEKGPYPIRKHEFITLVDRRSATTTTLNVALRNCATKFLARRRKRFRSWRVETLVVPVRRFRRRFRWNGNSLHAPDLLGIANPFRPGAADHASTYARTRACVDLRLWRFTNG